MCNNSFLIPDDDTACEGLFIGLPIWSHKNVDIASVLDEKRHVLDIATVGNSIMCARGGFISRIMLLRSINVIEDDTKPQM